MNPIAIQPYVKIERHVSSIQQQDIEDERNMYLYADKVITKHREFAMNEVMDMSYRAFGGQGGLLYLHTFRGVFSYTVKSSPMLFIDSFKELVNKK